MPVILSDEAELPFQNVIDYREISIKWPSSRIGPELLEYLESIPGIAWYSVCARRYSHTLRLGWIKGS